MQQTKNYQVAQTIFEQLKASKVHGFPFFAYTGLKPQIVSETELNLKAPRNPKHVKNILVQYHYDTYTVLFDTGKGKPLDTYNDIYADQLSDIIVSKMGVF